MAFLHKLWDETVAGPIPDDGIGNPVSATRSTTTGAMAVQVAPPNGDSRLMPVSRDLTVSVESSSSVPPGSSTSPSGSFKELTRRKSTSAALQSSGSREYDWIMLSALDR